MPHMLPCGDAVPKTTTIRNIPLLFFGLTHCKLLCLLICIAKYNLQHRILTSVAACSYYYKKKTVCSLLFFFCLTLTCEVTSPVMYDSLLLRFRLTSVSFEFSYFEPVVRTLVGEFWDKKDCFMLSYCNDSLIG